MVVVDKYWMVRVGMGSAACTELLLEIRNACLETLDYLANAAHFVKFDLQLVDFTEDGTEACDFSVGILDGVAGAVVLDLSGSLCLLGEILPSLLDGVHQTVEVGAQRLETCGIQQEATLAGLRCSTR